ncbi:Ras-related_protein Rap-1b [Hexamita inflata]|uniref:small monomeric GTPase n=1 Tax=Hexamita inflata TaxID=28002 RepID=A0AA86QCK7_9EUKA|nr:Ras-related protein Rap-1b [Hexamita inflata]
MAENTMKVVIVGAGAVGKSCISVRFILGKFVKKYEPTIENFYRKAIEVDSEITMLDILDTAGQEEFSALRDSYMYGGDGFVLVYAVNSINSFYEIEKLKEQILRIKGKESVPMVLVGNKCDMEDREVTTEQGENLAKQYGCQFVETSARENINIQQIFTKIVQQIRDSQKKEGTHKKKTKGCGSV